MEMKLESETQWLSRKMQTAQLYSQGRDLILEAVQCTSVKDERANDSFNRRLGSGW